MSNVVEYTYHNDSIDSTAIGAVWYNKNTQALYVEFVDSGTIAGYAKVPAEVVDAFMSSSSIGRYYAFNIKGKYHGLNTEDIEFREAFKPAPISWHSNGLSFNVPVTKKNTYTIVGEVTEVKTIQRTVPADSFEAALAEFKNTFGNKAKVTSVTLN